MGKFVIRKVQSGVKFDLFAVNGEKIATSEVYDTLSACRKGMESMIKNVEKAHFCDLTQGETAANPRFEIYQDRAGEFRFRLRARNGKVIASSEGYSGKAGCLAGVESVRQNAPIAVIETQ